jgi:hypothetical protein
MIVLHFEGAYTCFIDFNELDTLPSSRINGDLLDRDSKQSLDKEVSLGLGDVFGGDADLETVPGDSCWDDATGLMLTVSSDCYAAIRAKRFAKPDEGYSARLPYGDVFVSVVDDPEEFR